MVHKGRNTTKYRAGKLCAIKSLIYFLLNKHTHQHICMCTLIIQIDCKDIANNETNMTHTHTHTHTTDKLINALFISK